MEGRWRVRGRVAVEAVYWRRSRVSPNIGANEQNGTLVGNRVSRIGLVVRDPLRIAQRWRGLVEVLRSLGWGFIPIAHGSRTSVRTAGVEVVKWGSLRSWGVEELESYEIVGFLKNVIRYLLE